MASYVDGLGSFASDGHDAYLESLSEGFINFERNSLSFIVLIEQCLLFHSCVPFVGINKFKKQNVYCRCNACATPTCC